VEFIGRAFLFLVGLVLLAPGACSLLVLPAGLSTLSDMVAGRTPSELGGFVLMAGIWVAGLLLAALGVWLMRIAVGRLDGR
jgi:hypothetical protein